MLVKSGGKTAADKRLAVQDILPSSWLDYTVLSELAKVRGRTYT